MAGEKERSYRGLKLPARTRLTPQRRAVLDAIEASGGRFTAIDLFERARRSHPRLGLATTYRTLELLRRTGRSTCSPATGPAYIRCSPGHHHHLVCVSCGSVEETELCAAPSQQVLTRKLRLRPRVARPRHLRPLPLRVTLDRDPARRADRRLDARRRLLCAPAPSELTTLIALTGGIVVAVALFDVLPEAIDAVDDADRVGGLVGLGFLGFFLAHRMLVLHHRDETDEARAMRR